MATNRMTVLDRTGDTKVEWNPDNKDEVSAAEKQFKDLTKKGYIAFRLYDDGKKGEVLSSFDKFAEKMVLIPPVVGG